MAVEDEEENSEYEAELKLASAVPLDTLEAQLQKALQTKGLGDLEKKAAYVAKKLFEAENWEKALYYYKKQYEIHREMHGGDALIEAHTILFDMGYCCSELNQFNEAEEYYNKSLAGRKDAFGEESEKCALCYSNLGFVINKMSRYPEARDMYMRAVEIRTKINPPGFSSNALVEDLSRVGSISSSMLKFEEAIDWHTREYEMRLKMSGKDAQSQKIADALCHLGYDRSKLKQYGKALDYYSRSLEMYKAVWKDEPLHNDIDVGLFNVGHAYKNLEKYKESITFYKQCKEIREARYSKKCHEKVKAVYKAIANAMDKMPELKQEAKEWRAKCATDKTSELKPEAMESRKKSK